MQTRLLNLNYFFCFFCRLFGSFHRNLSKTKNAKIEFTYHYANESLLYLNTYVKLLIVLLIVLLAAPEAPEAHHPCHLIIEAERTR